MTHIFTIHRQPNEKGKQIYDDFKKTQKCFFVNAGNLRDSDDPWLKQNLTFEGDYANNIAKLNPRVNEMTAQYLVWKNLLQQIPEDEWVEFSHYRRWLKLPKALDDSVDLYVMKGISFKPNIEVQFRNNHPSMGWDILENCVKEHLPESEWWIFDEWKGTNIGVGCCNIMAAKPKILNQWWEWAFPKIFDINAQIPYESKKYITKYQGRAAGFISERLFMFWLYYQRAKGMKVQEVPRTFKRDLVVIA